MILIKLKIIFWFRYNFFGKYGEWDMDIDDYQTYKKQFWNCTQPKKSLKSLQIMFEDLPQEFFANLLLFFYSLVFFHV